MGNILVITDNLNAPPWYFCLDRYRHDIHWTGSGKNGEESKQVHFYFCKHIAAFCQASTQKQMHLHRYTKNPWKFKGFTELLTGIGPVTSALPMRRSTDWATAAFILFRSREPCIYYHEGRNLSTINLKKFSFDSKSQKGSYQRPMDLYCPFGFQGFHNGGNLILGHI